MVVSQRLAHVFRYSATFARYSERISKSAAFFSSDWYDAIIDDDRSKNAFGPMLVGADSMVIGIK